jgi:PAS domain S-box-containing protein
MFRLCIVACLFACSIDVVVGQSSGSPPAKNVLILYSFTAHESPDDFATLRSTLRSLVPGPVDFHVEYLESLRFDVPGYENGVADALAATYRGQRIDLVLTAFYPALRFAVDHRDQIFPGAPIVFFSITPKRFEGQKLWPGVTGVTITGGVKVTIDLALRLQPDTETVAIVNGNSAFEQFWLQQAHQDLRLRPGLKSIDLVGLPPGELLRRVATLPPHTVVLFQMIPEESAQPVMGTYQLLEAIARKFPTYCIQKHCLDHGAVGGSYADYSDQGVKAGEVGARILSGEEPEDIPVESGAASRAHVDWRQLQRWKIPKSALPAGTVILNSGPGFWQGIRPSVREWVLLGILAVAIVVVIGILRRYSSQMRRYIAYLREGEERFRVMTDAMPLLIWLSDARGQISYINRAALNFTGVKSEADLIRNWTAKIHEDDLKEAVDEFSESIKDQRGFSTEFRLRRADGEYRWVLDMATPRFNQDGSFAGLIGYASDITDQKKAQEALRNVGGRMIEAQEKERGRIARELHDDICQKLALLSMELEMSKRMVLRPGGPVEVRIEEMRQHCSGIAADVQALSHELHSSRLDYLGLTVALKSFCQEFSQQQNVNVDFNYEDVPDPLPKDISLSLFRIAQEGLHNSLKYSGVDHFSLHLCGSGDSVQLEISDTGAGFEVDEARGGKGLGLISMKERALLVNGSFAIESAPGGGTRIMVCVPLAGDPVEANDGDFSVEQLDREAALATRAGQKLTS